MIPKHKQKLTYLQWQDAYSNSSWFSHDDIQKKIAEDMFVVEEVGWIVYENKKEIHLCSRRCMADESAVAEYGMYQRIPKSWILKRKVFKV